MKTSFLNVIYILFSVEIHVTGERHTFSEDRKMQTISKYFTNIYFACRNSITSRLTKRGVWHIAKITLSRIPHVKTQPDKMNVK